MWIALPCATFSLARRAGGAGPPPLRSAQYPLGLPELSEANLEKVKNANKLLDASMSLALTALKRRLPGALENPAFSRMWACPRVESFLTQESVKDVFCDFCQYGEPFRKRTRLRFWRCTDVDRAGRLCKRTDGICSATGVAHIQLRGHVNGQFRTRAAQMYPKRLCEVLATILSNSKHESELSRKWNILNGHASTQML